MDHAASSATQLVTARREGWTWYLGMLAERRRSLLMVVAVGAIPLLSMMPVLWLIRHILDISLPAGDVGAIAWAGVAILVVRGAASGLVAVYAARNARVARSIAANMRVALVERLHRLRWMDGGLVESAWAHGRIVHDTERVELMSQNLFQAILPALVPLVIFILILLLLSWQLTLVLVILLPVLRLLTWLGLAKLRGSITSYQDAFEFFHLTTHRVIAMLPVSRIQGTEAVALASHRSSVDRLSAAGADMAAVGTLNTQMTLMTTTVVAVATLVGGGIAVTNNAMTAGGLIAFFVAATQVNAALGGILGGVPLLFAGDQALMRLAELRVIGEVEAEGGDVIPGFSRPLVLTNVSFGYPGRPLLAGVSMHADPGQMTAVAAPNGEGKTSLLELLLGLLRPSSGSVQLATLDLKDCDLAAFRRRTGMLPQHPSLFRGTIRDNILFGRSGLSELALERAAHLAGLEPVIACHPEGFDTMIGDNGDRLSGGERQRVALARALVHAPALLILDEPGNHLDTQALSVIIERLLTAPDRPTIVMATHDPRLLDLADTVYDLANGKLTQRRRLQLEAS